MKEEWEVSILLALFCLFLQEILPQNAMDLHEREIHFVFSFQKGKCHQGESGGHR